MDKKRVKKIILVIGSIIVIASIIAVIANLQKDSNIKDNEIGIIQGGNTAAEGMEPINQTIVLNDILQHIKNDEVNKLEAIEDNEANELLNLRNYVGLEKRVAQYIGEDEFTEVWLLKISEEAQAIDLFRMFDERIQNLRNEYKDNANIMEILQDENNIILKQQSGIVIMIISDDAENVEKSIDIEFLK